jgi:general secretion pathway protein D
MRRAWSLALAAAVALALTGCAANALRQAEHADDLQDYDLAVARYAKIVREHPENRDATEGLERAKLRASEAHFTRGRRLSSQGRYEDAVLELQLASELNPGNADAAHDLHEVRVALRAQVTRPEGGETSLESLLARTRDLAPSGYELPNTTLAARISTGQQATARTVFLTIARLANLSLTFDAQFVDVPAPVSLLSGMNVRQALDAVAAATNTFYQVTGPSTILIAPDTPAKRRAYTDEVVRQFTIQNVDVKETMDALRVVADARFISQITGTNTILVRDTPERMQVIGRFLSAFDKARPEIVVDVELLEVNRTRLREYGLQLASPGSPGIDGAADVNREGGVTLQSLRNLSQADVLMTGVPALYYRLLKTDARTRTLANPHIRVTDGATATANWGQDVPVPRVTISPITQGGIDIQPQTQFDYRTIGVNIAITPRTHPNDDVSLALNIELSSLGAPGFDGLPTFGKRNVQTVIRLKDGETNILAGLIREDERTSRETVPGLGDIPVLGNLFGRNHREAEQTDVVIMLTPHIIRVLDLTEEDLRPLRLPREGAGGITTTVGGPTLEPRDPRPSPQAPAAAQPPSPITPAPPMPIPSVTPPGQSP